MHEKHFAIVEWTSGFFPFFRHLFSSSRGIIEQVLAFVAAIYDIYVAHWALRG